MTDRIVYDYQESIQDSDPISELEFITSYYEIPDRVSWRGSVDMEQIPIRMNSALVKMIAKVIMNKKYNFHVICVYSHNRPNTTAKHPRTKYIHMNFPSIDNLFNNSDLYIELINNLGFNRVRVEYFHAHSYTLFIGCGTFRDTIVFVNGQKVIKH